MKKYFKNRKNSSAVAFLYDSIFITLLAKNKSNKIIISERGDPAQSSDSKTVAAFMKTEFLKADGIVFQSSNAQKWYLENTPAKGTVIFNPVKSDLPEPYYGERKKRIVNFCRISAQKNLIMLVDAFAEFHKQFPDYELDIIGDPVGNNADGYIDSVIEHIKHNNCENCIHIIPSRKDIHDYIKDYAMFVSSSDFEGMSNSMLEAMAIGLPCVCTDCPAGGARAVIKDGYNGLLTPVGDSHNLYLAMKKIAENPKLATKLSQNSVKIREEQSVDKIIKKWMELING
jgi:glycosyltransferase involved in cell wall biosynthesis